MKETLLTVLENTRLADGIYRLRLAGDTSAITAPGQFVNLKLSGFFLRRPISVCDWENGEVTLIYKVLGHGTEAMTGMAVGTALDVLTGLGNGFDSMHFTGRITYYNRRTVICFGFSQCFKSLIHIRSHGYLSDINIPIAHSDFSKIFLCN